MDDEHPASSNEHRDSSNEHREPSNEQRPLAVRTSGVVKSFGRGESAVKALKGVDFEAWCGELVMIVGPSGCGKTTFLSVMCGTLRADEGQIEVFGTDLAKIDRKSVV